MKLIRRLLTLALAFLPLVAAADEQHTFVRNYDLNNPTIAATTNYLITSTNFTDATTFTLAHQPADPRNVTVAVTDTTPSIVAGTITVTGTNVNGAVQTEVFDLSTGLTFTGVKVFSTITSIVSAGVSVLGGAGDETIIAGVGSTTAFIYCTTSDPINGMAKVTTSGSSTTVTTVNSLPAFGVPMAAGDDIVFQTGPGTILRRTVSAVVSDTQITIDSAADLSAKYTFSWRHVACGYSDTDGWQMVNNVRGPNVKVDLGDGSGAALTAVGGVDISVECRFAGDGTAPAQILTTNLTSTLKPTNSQVIPILENCASLRIGLRFGTNDSAGTDSVSAYWLGNSSGPTH